ncbi:MAG: 50S ribosomal protein L24 [Candidatus Riflebacteria bacterium]|nr:50S ribosomal protein L24 [Candidatus Riflebacteria bacterium]
MRRAVARPHVKKGDKVQIIKGEYKGKQGRVLAVFPKKGTAIVEGVNIIKRHTRPSKELGRGGIIEKEAPVALGKIALLGPDGKFTRARIDKSSGEKNRVCAKTGEPLG